ncbi:alpha/beta hydrolase [Blastopirellula marina]|uniref:Alpha/beta hydrolase n=1 Tax=Blastopirellula marina TaxID=124 RepID=A0A2S8G468_9BACT|nr:MULTISPECIES: alpha/beta hydrolase [Pirellulaceae]PQO39246.1 alpha/beta hydrolase [Blastopirellula marina]RCS55554.1 alpha/beta hydrolase [Bremerella cremea]
MICACRTFAACVAACLLLTTSLLQAEQEKKSIKNIEFAKVDGHSLKLDLYLPKQKDAPLVVYIHGGGWHAGSKDGCPITWLNDHGIAVASISYRLTDKATFPAQIQDCKGAVRWLRAHAKEYGYSADKIGVAGSSAGGHLAALMGTSGDVKELEGDVGGNLEYSSRVDAVVDYYGATDFILRSKTQPHRANEKGSVVYKLLGGGANEKVDLAKQASAAYHVTKDDPPFLVIHGDKDKTVLLDQSQRIQEVYGEAGLPLELIVIQGGGHGGAEFYKGEPRQRAIEFFRQQLIHSAEEKK